MIVNNQHEHENFQTVKKGAADARRPENLSEHDRLATVRKNCWAIQHIDNPSEAVQMMAVKRDVGCLRHIKNPTKAVQLFAVDSKIWGERGLEHIKNPDEDVLLAAARVKGKVIRGIQNPSEAVQLAAIAQDAWSVQFIQNPGHSIQIAAIERHFLAIGACSDFFNPSFSEFVQAGQNHAKNPYPLGGLDLVRDAIHACIRIMGDWPREQIEEALEHIPYQVKVNETFQSSLQALLQRRELTIASLEEDRSSRRTKGVRTL